MAQRFTDSIDGRINASKVERALEYLSLNEDSNFFDRSTSPKSDSSEIHDPFDEDDGQMDVTAISQQINKRVSIKKTAYMLIRNAVNLSWDRD